ncbi:MAG: DNA polymerase III subunit alpha [Alphaproteobacteria bacterium]|nr:DNA polymerase III subunit alpha [Alphaproteobacteria bacterium]
MPHADFVHLRVHSAYSLAEGALRVKDLVALCADHDMPAVAVTDSGNLFGALEFSQAAMAAGVQPIIGCTLGITREDADRHNGLARPAPDHMVLLAQNDVGYRNLLKLVSQAFLKTDAGEAPQVSLDDLIAHNAGLIALTGGPDGPVGRLAGAGQDAAAEQVLTQLKSVFGDRLYVELMRHGLESEAQIEDALIGLAYAHDIPLVATNQAMFADEAMHEAHDVLLCIAEGSYVSEADRRRVTREHRFKSAKEMRALFADLPEAIDNSLVIAQRCAFAVEPIKPILPAYNKLDGRSEAEALRDLSSTGLEDRLRAIIGQTVTDGAEREVAAKPYRDRLDYELGVIEQMGFPGYFLIVADFMQWARGNAVPVGPGRGSGAGSVVAWSLGITDLDPLRWGLLFERFLNPERVSMPDFDIDFCQDQREAVIRYVQSEYGYDRVAQIITFGKLQARAVVRDVGRALQLPYGLVDRICKMIPNNPAKPVTLQQAIDGEPALQNLRAEDEAVDRMMTIALKLEGLYRHASTHAAGVVIGDRPLDELIPLYRDPRSDMPVTQYNMKWVEQAGLVKFDFLGLKTLTVLERTLELIGQRADPPSIDLSNLPLDDPVTFEMLGRAETTGVFQLESSGMRDVLRKLRPDRFEDIIAVVALYRPGPMDNIPSYIKRKHGEEAVDYLHPDLEEILKETYGIMIYQEQVMEIAQRLSGYSLGGADLLRRAMGKKIQAEMDAQRERFLTGAAENGVAAAQASLIFDQVNKFAGYGFNKSHAAAYAMVAYQTAYLKANYPVEFMAASMTLDMGNTDKLNVFRSELQRLGIALLPPDVNASHATFTVEALPDGAGAIRYALAAIRNVGEAAMDMLVAERKSGGQFKDLGSFANRIDARAVNKRMLENLVRAGAFDRLEPNRAKLEAGLDVVLRHASAAHDERESGQAGLFGDGMPLADDGLRLPERPAHDELEQLGLEKEALGFYLSAHPLDRYQAMEKRLRVTRYGDLALSLPRGGSGAYRLFGIPMKHKIRTSARGNRYAFAEFSDASASFEGTLFSEVLAQSRDLLDAKRPVLLKVTAEDREGEIKLLVQEVEDLDEAVSQTAAGLQIFLKDAVPIDGIQAILAKQKPGRSEISLKLDVDEQEVEIRLPKRLALNPATRAAIKAVPGVVAVQDL